MIAPVTEIDPATSKWRWATSILLSRRSHGVAATTTAAIGRLMKKIQDQLRYDVRTPPRRTPAAPPLPDAAPQMPRATLRSRPSGNVVISIDRAAGVSNAPP